MSYYGLPFIPLVFIVLRGGTAEQWGCNPPKDDTRSRTDGRLKEGGQKVDSLEEEDT